MKLHFYREVEWGDPVWTASHQGLTFKISPSRGKWLLRATGKADVRYKRRDNAFRQANRICFGREKKGTQ